MSKFQPSHRISTAFWINSSLRISGTKRMEKQDSAISVREAQYEGVLVAPGMFISFCTTLQLSSIFSQSIGHFI